MTHRLLVLCSVWAAVSCAARPEGGPVVRPGIDVLLTDSIHLVRGRRVGLLTNQTGVDRAGTADVDRIVAAGIDLAAIFSPEHGYRGGLDEENIGNAVDSATGAPIYSLYGSVRAPTAEMLEGIDVLLVDLQDIGGRPYTYVSTALLAMRSAAAHRIPVLLLDRPNPIGGAQVQGPVLDTAFASFTGMLPVPMRHGMTLGELVRFGNRVLGIGADLTVVPVAGWRRDMWFDATGLPWVRPSPSMPDLASATHYPGTVIFEATNLSVGRGTPVAFQVIGAPWLDTGAVRAALGATAGAAVTDTVFVPDTPPDGKYDGVPLRGLVLRVTDRGGYDPAAVAVALLAAVHARQPDSLTVSPDHLARLIGTDRVWAAIEAGTPAAEIAASWTEALEAFREAAGRDLLYR
jgi:uncharacterized protein YbbC (DUF1343 family)